MKENTANGDINPAIDYINKLRGKSDITPEIQEALDNFINHANYPKPIRNDPRTNYFDGLTYSDVLFVPQYSEIESRSEIDTSTELGGIRFNLPVISANMKDITGYKMALELSKHGGLGILHRFNSIEDAIEELMLFQKAYEAHNKSESFSNRVGVSVGVQEEDKKRFHALKDAGAKMFCIDVAHGHHVKVRRMIEFIRGKFDSNEVKIIAGNIATPSAAKDLEKWGADAVKVGIGPGAACQTRKNTGVGVPQLAALSEIRNATDIHIVADGGITSTGDIAKAMKFADSVMVGSFISGTSETPGDVFRNMQGEFYKVYGGSASGERKTGHGKENKFVEGSVKTVPFRGHVKYIFKEIKENLQSSMSYSGCRNIKEFHESALLKKISGGAKVESKI
jgi:IMP dehydrogenase